MQTKQTMDV